MDASPVRGIIGKKLGMTQVYVAGGKAVPVTVIEAGPCPVVQVKTEGKDGYEAIQLAFGVQKEFRVSRPEVGHLKKAGVAPNSKLKEFRVTAVGEAKPGEVVTVEVFNPGDKLCVTGTSKGKGFQGVIRRHNFSGGRATHGSMFHRAPGSIGASAYPSRVIKGKKLPGQMGNVQVTVKNIEVVRVMPEENLLLVRGAVPGPRGGMLVIALGKPAKKAEA